MPISGGNTTTDHTSSTRPVLQAVLLAGVSDHDPANAAARIPRVAPGRLDSLQAHRQRPTSRPLCHPGGRAHRRADSRPHRSCPEELLGGGLLPLAACLQGEPRVDRVLWVGPPLGRSRNRDRLLAGARILGPGPMPARQLPGRRIGRIHRIPKSAECRQPDSWRRPQRRHPWCPSRTGDGAGRGGTPG